MAVSCDILLLLQTFTFTPNYFLKEAFGFFGLLNHCVKSVRIRNYSCPHFPAFGLSTEGYSVSLCIQSKCQKIWTRITPSTNIFHAVNDAVTHPQSLDTGRILSIYKTFKRRRGRLTLVSKGTACKKCCSSRTSSERLMFN